MIVLNETIEVQREAPEVFAYVSDFCTTVEWDATAQTAVKKTPGPVTVGTVFRVNCALPVGSVDIDYQVISLDPPHVIELRGRSRWFEVTDRIEITACEHATVLSYRAEFRFPSWLEALESRFRPGMVRMGEASVAGLKRALEDDNPPPRLEPDNCSVARRLKRFTRLGYREAKRHWLPMSARLEGRHAVITGATSGLGEVTALELARRGAALTLVARNREKALQAKADIIAETGNDNIHVELADLTLLREVDHLCQRLQQRGLPIDILVNNAGALFGEYACTDEGYERSLALLLLAPCRLTLGLQELLSASGDARVINVVSGGMYTQRLSLETLLNNDPQKYSGPVAYAQAKRALMAVTERWAAQWREAGIVVNAMHPGWVNTPGLAQALPGFRKLTRYWLRTPEQGADTIVWLAAATEAGRVSDGLFLDRQSQPLYLRPSSRETEAARRDVLEWMRGQICPEGD